MVALNQIKPGSYVKRYNGKEWYWVKVDRIADEIIYGTCANNLIDGSMSRGDPDELALDDVLAVRQGD